MRYPRYLCNIAALFDCYRATKDAYALSRHAHSHVRAISLLFYDFILTGDRDYLTGTYKLHLRGWTGKSSP